MGTMEGSVAVVTGAARGIGRSICERFLSEGARVALLDLDARVIKDLADELGDRSIAIPVDVGDETSVHTAIDQVVVELGEVDILVNNAAASHTRNRVSELTLAEWDRTIRINLTGVFLTSRAVLASMKRSGGGVIINVASQLGSVAVPSSAAYCASKGGVLQLTKAMAIDHASDGVRVNSLSPGAVLTERLTSIYGTSDEASRILSPKHPIGRIGTPEEIAGAAVFLAGKDSTFMTGADLIVDGGYTAQ